MPPKYAAFQLAWEAYYILVNTVFIVHKMMIIIEWYVFNSAKKIISIFFHLPTPRNIIYIHYIGNDFTTSPTSKEVGCIEKRIFPLSSSSGQFSV